MLDDFWNYRKCDQLPIPQDKPQLVHVLSLLQYEGQFMAFQVSSNLIFSLCFSCQSSIHLQKIVLVNADVHGRMLHAQHSSLDKMPWKVKTYILIMVGLSYLFPECWPRRGNVNQLIRISLFLWQFSIWRKSQNCVHSAYQDWVIVINGFHYLGIRRRTWWSNIRRPTHFNVCLRILYVT